MVRERSNSTIAIFAALSITYWIKFFGHEMIQTLLLFQHGNSIYRSLGDERTKNTTISHLRRITPHNPFGASFPKSNATIKIPLIMHRMWRDEDIPIQWKSAYQKCNAMYKQRNWTVILWTDATIQQFLANHYSYILPLYDSYWYDIQRVDAARYFILYHYGGVYLDMDIGCQNKKDLTDLIAAMELIKMGSMFPLTEPIGMSNDVMFASKGNPFFEDLIEALPSKNKWYGSPYLTVLFSTGPMFLSLVYMNNHFANEEVLALSPTLYSDEGTRFFCHLPGSTWHGIDAYAVKWLWQNSWFALAAVISAYHVRVAIGARLSKSIRLTRREAKSHRLSL